MRSMDFARMRPWILGTAGCAVLLYLARPSPTQQTQPAGAQETPKRDVGKTSYDQIAPVLMGQETFDAVMKRDKAAKAEVMARQQALLEARYDLTRKVDAKCK